MGVDPSDEALLAGYATGDPRTAAAFVRRFQGRVYGLALTIVRQPALAEEVAQETFTRVYRHAGNYDARKGRVSTWLLSIARNLAIDVTRLKRLDPVDPEVIEAEVTIDFQAPGADEAGLQPDERDQLRSAISDLPDDQRRAIVLAAYLGRTAREISDLDDVPLGTVKTRIRTAMLKLRSEMEVQADGSALRRDQGAGGGTRPRHRRGRGARPRSPAPRRLPGLPPARWRSSPKSPTSCCCSPPAESPRWASSRGCCPRSLPTAGAGAAADFAWCSRRRRPLSRRSRSHSRSSRPTCGLRRIIGTPCSRPTARSSSPTLCAGRGMRDVGTVFSYEGSPVVGAHRRRPGPTQRTHRRRAGHATEGSQVPLRRFHLDQQGGWGGSIPVDPKQVSVLRLSGAPALGP